MKHAVLFLLLSSCCVRYSSADLDKLIDSARIMDTMDEFDDYARNYEFVRRTKIILVAYSKAFYAVFIKERSNG